MYLTCTRPQGSHASTPPVLLLSDPTSGQCVQHGHTAQGRQVSWQGGAAQAECHVRPANHLSPASHLTSLEHSGPQVPQRSEDLQVEVC